MIKNLLALSLLLVPAAAFAVSPPATLLDPVVVPEMGFTAKVEGGRVIAAWKRYKRDDFYAYVLLKSNNGVDPAYVPKKGRYETRNAADLEFQDGAISAGPYRYRLVIVTTFGDLWVSPVVNLNITDDQLKHPVPTVADFE